MISHFASVVNRLESREIMPKRAPSLDRTRRALCELGLDPDTISERVHRNLERIVLIAGTNGKGSVGATLERLLISQGQRVGFFSSPHLESYCERIRILGTPISEEEFAITYSKVTEICGEESLSHFEILTVMAAWVFFSTENQPPVDWALFEVGLGGTWDATNAIVHATCIICSLAHDHEHLLGPTLKDIARNKFGIIPSPTQFLPQGALVISAPIDSSLQSLQRETQHQTQCRWVTPQCAHFRVDAETSPPKYYLQSPWGEALLKLPGQRGVDNTMLALTAFESLGFDPTLALTHLKEVHWPGRMEALTYQKRTIYLSGDHNPAGVKSLIEMLPFFPHRQIHFVVGIGKTKDADTILNLLFNVPQSNIYLTQSPFEGRSLTEYGLWKEKARYTNRHPHQALERAISNAHSEDLIIVTGSLYLVGDLRAKIFAKNQ